MQKKTQFVITKLFKILDSKGLKSKRISEAQTSTFLLCIKCKIYATQKQRFNILGIFFVFSWPEFKKAIRDVKCSKLSRAVFLL
jgi:hypothetical protein